jgi:TRAP-type mannitol/chloroaromatic compound transport system permease large subunit
MGYIRARLTEASSYAGIAAAVSAIGPMLGLSSAIVAAIVSALGAIAVFVRESGAKA